MSDEGLPSWGNEASHSPASRSLLVIWVILCVLLVYVLIARYARPMWLGEEIGVDSSRIEQVEQRLDPNVADWAELARLPGIGEATAKRIVAHREDILARRGPEATSRPVFTSLRDLDAVRGIGTKTLEEIAPYLKFPESEKAP